MSGCGRKSHYRKSVTDQFLNGFPLPLENEKIARAINSRGTNIFEIEVEDGSVELALLPNKFKKLIWIKRGDYLIVSNTSCDSLPHSSTCESNNAKVKYLVSSILSRDQVKHIIVSGLWPERFNHVESKSLTRDVDIMPDYEYEDENDDEEEAEVKIDKMGNTILP